MPAAKVMSCRATAQAMGVKPPRTGTYRRSTTTKAPRKRTFVYHMQKYSMLASDGGAGAAWMLSQGRAAGAGAQCCATCCGTAAGATPAAGLDGGDNNGNNRFNARRTGGNDDDGVGGGRSVSTGLPRAVLLGAGVLLASLVLAPGQAAAGDGQAHGLMGLRKALAVPVPVGRRVSAVADTTPGNMCLNMPASVGAGAGRKGGRVGLGGAAGGVCPDAIVYGRVELSDAERRMAANRQLFLRETVRVV